MREQFSTMLAQGFAATLGAAVLVPLVSHGVLNTLDYCVWLLNRFAWLLLRIANRLHGAIAQLQTIHAKRRRQMQDTWVKELERQGENA